MFLALALEQPFDRFDVAAIGEKHDQVILVFDHGVVVRHDDRLAARDSDDAGAFRQVDFLDTAPDDARALGRAVHDYLDRFGQAAAERMYAHDIAAAWPKRSR
jgi:hypothetical protein